MEETDPNFIIRPKIKTLVESLNQFGKPNLLAELDEKLELIRRNKETKKNLLQYLKTIDKDLLKLSRIHHPDKAIGEKKSNEEAQDAQNLQIAINATRTVLKALTEEFLKDIDVHYKYEFFANLDINTLINEKQMDIEINNVLCKISRLSEVKRVNVVGEIRKFLQESRECLKNFLEGRNSDFVRHRDYALRHLSKCIEGYKILEMECKLIIEDCSVDSDENTKRAIQKIHDQGLKESEILQDLERVSEQSLSETFKHFPIYKSQYDPMKPIVPKEHEYFVLPFKFYVDVLLICSVMVDTKMRRKSVMTRIGNFLDSCMGIDMEKYVESALLKAACRLLSYLNSRSCHKEKYQINLKENDHNSNTFQELVEIVNKIDHLLVEEFDINHYKKGKYNREQFNERLFELNNTLAEFKEIEKNLLAKIKLYEQETNKTQKEYSELSEKREEVGQECQENPISKQKDLRENVESEDNIKVHEKTTDYEKHFLKCLPDCIQNISNSHNFIMTLQSSSSNENGYSTIFEGDGDKIILKQTPQSRSDFLQISDYKAVSEKVQQNTNANSIFPECNSGCENTNQSAQVAKDQRCDFPRQPDQYSKVHTEETSCFRRDQLPKAPLSAQLSECLFNKRAEANKFQQNTIANSTILDYIFGCENTNPTGKMDKNHCQDFPRKHEYPKMHEETICINKDQLPKTPLCAQLSECASIQQAEANKILQNTKANSSLIDYISGCEHSNQSAQVAKAKCYDFLRNHDGYSNVHVKETPCFSRDQLPKTPLSVELSDCVSSVRAEANEFPHNTKANVTFQDYISGCENTNKTAQVAKNQCRNCLREYNDFLNMHSEETPRFSRDKLHTEPLSRQLYECVPSQQTEADKFIENTKVNNANAEYITGNENVIETAHMTGI